MQVKGVLVVFTLLAGSFTASAQQTSQAELKIESTNRTLTVNAEASVSVEPDVALLHIGFETQPADAKPAYAAGAKISNEIVAAIKQAGVPETSIRSQGQRLARVYGSPHKFILTERWTVMTPPARVAEILDIAVAAGATDSGEIEWTVENMQALEDQALEQATTRARANAGALAGGMGVHLGALLYVTNQVSLPEALPRNYPVPYLQGVARAAESLHPLPIEPHTASTSAHVTAVYAIE
jgi:uncharacterized protein YggE